MRAHAIEVETGDAGLFRWRCLCGEAGAWKLVALSARIGGQRHVAAMERGK